VGQGRFAAAIPIFEGLTAYRDGRGLDRTIAYDPRIFGVDAYDSLATCYFRLGRYRESARYFALASAEEPGTIEYKVKWQLAEQLSRRPHPAPTPAPSAARRRERRDTGR
jgi:tetratricopeptide (TPR) repeat protein